jgi:hypothetical protein
MFASQKYSIPKGKNSIVNEVRPAPGSYNVPHPDKPHPISFSKKKRDSLIDEARAKQPGPGKYSPELKNSKD